MHKGIEMTIIHGGNVYEVAARLGCSPDALLDYSASINPLGPPSGLLEEFTKVFHWLQHYPDIGNTRLVESIARFHGVKGEQVTVGNGSTELIYWLPRVLGVKKVAVVLPTFGEYRKAFEMESGSIHKLITVAENGFQPTVESLESLLRQVSPEAILFTSPSSPAGTVLSKEVKDWIFQASRSEKMFCIVDEVFVDFCEGESLKGHLAHHAPGLILIRSLTKFYGIPGLRLGYVLACEEVTRRMKDLLPPWSVNTLAQMAGSFCLAQEDYRRETLALVQKERERMRERLISMGPLKVFPGRANYLLVQLGPGLPSSWDMTDHLLKGHGILIRDCTSFEGLNDRFVRLAVRMPDQNDALLQAIEEWVQRSHSPP